MKVPRMIMSKLDNTLERLIVQLIDKDYSILAGNKVRDMFARDVVQLVHQVFREPNTLEVGQLQWIGVDAGEKPSYGKNASNTVLRPVVLTPVSRDDLEMMEDGYSHREVREHKMVRMINEAYEQGALLTHADLAMILSISTGTVSVQTREYMEREKKVLPTRGIMHDIGRTMTHKRIVIRLYLQGRLVPEIARMVDHSEEAVNRYVKAFNKVRRLSDHYDVKGISRTLEISESLVQEYLDILSDYLGGDTNA